MPAERAVGWKLRIIVLVFWSSIAYGLNDRLREFELLHHSKIVGLPHNMRHRRSAASGNQYSHDALYHLDINTSARRLHLLLTENKGVFAPGFSVTTLQADGSQKLESFNPRVFYHGVVQGESGSEVFLQTSAAGTINAKIVTHEETYYIEPSYPHLPKSDNYSMIAYKASDLITPNNHHTNRSFCGGVHYNSTKPQKIGTSSPSSPDRLAKRERRQTKDGSKNTCNLLLVMDRRFLEQVMGGDMASATNYIVDLVSRVNSVYRTTLFEELGTSYGFQIERILYDNRSCSSTDDCVKATSSNCLPKGCSEQHMLDAFGRVERLGSLIDYQHFCLAHLFTAYSFYNGVLGLAYIASPLANYHGGICSKSFHDPVAGGKMYLNTGWSTSLNKDERKILTQEAEIVLAHELGHNFGSEHDPDTKECSPSDSSGNYIMYTYAVDGFKANNRRFSKCSRNSIAQVLSKKAACFKDISSQIRGNFHRDPGEECDAGIYGDHCCTNTFQYQPGAQCSVTNDVCCTNCSILKAKNKICTTGSDINCIETSVCDGESPNCTITYKQTGSKCFKGYGRCVYSAGHERRCVQFPNVIGISQCHCKEEAHLCTLCYLENNICQPFPIKKMADYLKVCPDDPKKDCSILTNHRVDKYLLSELRVNGDYIQLVNTSCTGGQCNRHGICERQSTDFVARFWDFLSHLDPNTFVEFMQANIVGTTVVFSFMLWLPGVILVYCYDKKQAQLIKNDEFAVNSMMGYLLEDTYFEKSQMF